MYAPRSHLVRKATTAPKPGNSPEELRCAGTGWHRRGTTIRPSPQTPIPFYIQAPPLAPALFGSTTPPPSSSQDANRAAHISHLIRRHTSDSNPSSSSLSFPSIKGACSLVSLVL
jgi:hypothetical protein